MINQLVFSILIVACPGQAQAASIGSFTPRQAEVDFPAPGIQKAFPIPEATARISEEQRLMASIQDAPGDIALLYQLADERAAMADRAYQQGDISTAVDYLFNALSIRQGQPQRWEQLGDWSSEVQSEDAQRISHFAYAQALLLSTHSRPLHLKLAAILADRQNYADAISHMESALDTDEQVPGWNELVLLATFHIRNNTQLAGMDYFEYRYVQTGDERFLLAEAILMDASGQGEAAATLAALVASSDSVETVFKQYALKLQQKFLSAGNQRLLGELSAAEGEWLPAGAEQ